MATVEHIHSSEESGFVTSVGGFGFKERTYNRQAYTPVAPVESADSLDFYQQATRKRLADKETGRSMVRGLVRESALQDFVSGFPHKKGTLEVAIPLRDELKGERIWFVVLGENGNSRQSPHTQEQVRTYKENSYREPIPAQQLVESVLTEGGSFSSDLEDPHIRDQVFSLWQKRFDWEQDDIDNLAKRLAKEKTLPAEERSIWFSGVVGKDGNVKAAAMAEALDFPLENGEVVRFVESTEWASGENGYIKPAVAYIGSQVYADNPKGNVVLFAECNMINAAPTIAHATGYSIPTAAIGDLVPSQVLQQNVHVGDGENDHPYRDFLWMHISTQARAQLYPPEAVKKIIERTRN